MAGYTSECEIDKELCHSYGTARFKLQECMSAQLHAHDTIIIACLCALKRLMTYELPVSTSRTHVCVIARAQHWYINIRYVHEKLMMYELLMPS